MDLCNTRSLSKQNFVYKLNFGIMSILTVLVVLIVAGIILYLINTYIQMDGKIKSILNIVVVILIIIWLLKVFGILGSLSSIKV